MTDDELKAAAKSAFENGSVMLHKALTPEQIRKLSEYVMAFYQEAKAVPFVDYVYWPWVECPEGVWRREEHEIRHIWFSTRESWDLYFKGSPVGSYDTFEKAKEAALSRT
jgi:hypothetical protein